MTWLAFSCNWLRLSPPMGWGFSRGLDFWLGAVGGACGWGLWVGPVVVRSSRSKSWSLARFSFCKASYSTSGWFQIWRITGNQWWKQFSRWQSLDLPTITNKQELKWWRKMLTKVINKSLLPKCNSAIKTARSRITKFGEWILFLNTCPPPHLAADTESLQWIEAEPASVPCLFEAVHKLCVERPLQGRQANQDNMFLFGGQLVLQDVMTSSGIRQILQSAFVKCYKT